MTEIKTFRIVMSDESIAELCKVLGIEHNRCSHLQLEFEPGLPVLATVALFGDERLTAFDWEENAGDSVEVRND